MPIIQVGTYTIYYECVGEGIPLLLMHGWTDIGCDLLPVAQALSGYRCILPDLPGYGRSVPPFRTFPPDFYRRDTRVMSAFVDALNLSSIHVAGFSDGGEVALMMGVMRPDLCRSVIAWGAIGSFGLEAAERARRSKMPSWFDSRLEEKHPGQNVYQWHRAWVEGFAAMVESGGDLSLSRAAEITCPLLLLLGEKDALNPPSAGRLYIRHAAREGVIRQFQEIKEAGHPIHTDQPDAFVRSVRSFLKMVDQHG
ncbi:MAG: alpha/beta hydrolase [Anaerolinea sp.]|nr:alpha/beta hydrolase [Anaerolinea sp.]CAG1014697.1 AB hydrolase superfamily protein YvaM [Anaerolineae bacterium]